MDTVLSDIYGLLAGQPQAITKRLSLDWRRSFGLYLWWDDILLQTQIESRFHWRGVASDILCQKPIVHAGRQTTELTIYIYCQSRKLQASYWSLIHVDASSNASSTTHPAAVRWVTKGKIFWPELGLIGICLWLLCSNLWSQQQLLEAILIPDWAKWFSFQVCNSGKCTDSRSHGQLLISDWSWTGPHADPPLRGGNRLENWAASQVRPCIQPSSALYRASTRGFWDGASGAAQPRKPPPAAYERCLQLAPASSPEGHWGIKIDASCADPGTPRVVNHRRVLAHAMSSRARTYGCN